MDSESKRFAAGINWYPGHMKKTREMIQENLKLVDAVIEVIDARIPVSSRNPIIDDLVKNKTRIVVLNKIDLADDGQTEAWRKKLTADGTYAVAVNCSAGTGIGQIYRYLDQIKADRNRESARKRPLRLMIVGVPNAGKSSLINKLTGRKSAKTGDRPGVTRGKQWLTLKNGMQLLDTPGILWPKFEDQQVGIKLSLIGSIKDDILNLDELSLELLRRLHRDYPGVLEQRFGIQESDKPLEMLEAVSRVRNCLLKGQELDYSKAARLLLEEFRNGKIGRITLERPEEERAEERQ